MERHQQERDFWHMLAALAPWATVSVNRTKDAPPVPLTAFMGDAATRLQTAPEREAIPPHAPGETPPGYWRGKFGLVKLAPPGTRYPSSRPPEMRDDIIERLDAYSTRVNSHG